MLRIDLSEITTIVENADDAVVLVVARNVIIQMRFNKVIPWVISYLGQREIKITGRKHKNKNQNV